MVVGVTGRAQHLRADVAKRQRELGRRMNTLGQTVDALRVANNAALYPWC